MDRVIFDSRPLFSRDPDDEIEQVSQQRKPKSPVRKFVTGSRPLLRLVGRNDLSLVEPWVKEWTQQIREWVDAGLEPYVFAHTPDDQFAPDFAAMFVEQMQPAAHSQSNPATVHSPIQIKLKNQPKKIQRSLF